MDNIRQTMHNTAFKLKSKKLHDHMDVYLWMECTFLIQNNTVNVPNINLSKGNDTYEAILIKVITITHEYKVRIKED